MSFMKKSDPIPSSKETVKEEKKEWYKVKDVCEEFNLSQTFVISQINSGKLKASHPGKIYLIHRSWVMKWLEDNLIRV